MAPCCWKAASTPGPSPARSSGGPCTMPPGKGGVRPPEDECPGYQCVRWTSRMRPVDAAVDAVIDDRAIYGATAHARTADRRQEGEHELLSWRSHDVCRLSHHAAAHRRGHGGDDACGRR